MRSNLNQLKAYSRFFTWVILALSFSGCTLFLPIPPCPPPPSIKSPDKRIHFCSEPACNPLQIPDPAIPHNLSMLVSLALENSPLTRKAWYRTKSAAADLGEARGAYLPPIAFTTTWTKEQLLITDEPGFVLPISQTSSDITLSTAYLLFDFGGRNANLNTALAALSTMNWFYNWEVQTVIITVIQNYYNYINAKEVYSADLLTVGDLETTLDAALTLKNLGVKSLSDELQAKTALLQARVALEKDKGAMQVALANLVQSLGLSPESDICVDPLPPSFPLEMVCQDVETMLQAASTHRADLAAARSRVVEHKYKIQSARSKFFPTITTNLVGGKGWINECGPNNEYSIHFALNYPLFNSFADMNALRRAHAEMEAAKAELDQGELEAFLTVLTDYYDFLANNAILKWSEMYLETATENQSIAQANYLAGMTTIIDLMTANHLLNEARIQLADAKVNFLTSIANISYDTGSLSTRCFQPCEVR